MDLIRGTGWVEASPGSTGHQLEHGVGKKENQTILEQKNAERCCKTESITTFRAMQKSMMKIQDIYVKSKSVSSWSYRRDINPIKNFCKKKKSRKGTLILMRVTLIHIFLLDCSTISNNSNNSDIFIERTTKPRSTPQPLVTKTMSASSLRTQSASTQNKLLSEGKIYFDGNLTSIAQFLTDIALSISLPLPGHYKKEETLNTILLDIIRGGWERGKSYGLSDRYSSLPYLCLAVTVTLIIYRIGIPLSFRKYKSAIC